jgi:hypothetical protein
MARCATPDVGHPIISDGIMKLEEDGMIGCVKIQLRYLLVQPDGFLVAHFSRNGLREFFVGIELKTRSYRVLWTSDSDP